MGDRSGIEWTDATWPIVTGCDLESPGCTNCYAMREAGGRLRNHPRYAGLTRPSRAGPVWNGRVRFNEELLDQPLRWRKPRMIFVPSMGDIFHEAVTDEQLDRISAVMALTPQHTYQVLTKRPERARAVLSRRFMGQTVWDVADGLACDINLSEFHPAYDYLCLGKAAAPWPLPNVWLGTSVEDQRRADERIPHLLATPAAVRFLSVEPLLGPVNLEQYIWPGCIATREEHERDHDGGLWCDEVNLDWVIVGGESGPGARPMHPDWPLALRDQCDKAGVAFFFKQWGAWADGSRPEAGAGIDRRVVFNDGYSIAATDATCKEAARLRNWSDARPAMVARVGKKAAGRVLDGRTHDVFPVTA